MTLLVAGALRGGATWARYLVGLLAVANAAVLVWAALPSHEVHWCDVVWPIVIYAVVAGYLVLDEIPVTSSPGADDRSHGRPRRQCSSA
jgi:uncharacterized membrane protein